MEKVRLLDTEKMKTEKAFHDFLPKTIIRDLKRKRVCFHKKVNHTVKMFILIVTYRAGSGREI